MLSAVPLVFYDVNEYEFVWVCVSSRALIFVRYALIQLNRSVSHNAILVKKSLGLEVGARRGFSRILSLCGSHQFDSIVLVGDKREPLSRKLFYWEASLVYRTRHTIITAVKLVHIYT